MKADLEKIKWLFENVTNYRISKEICVSQTTLGPLRNGERSLTGMRLGLAIKLTELAEKLQKEI